MHDEQIDDEQHGSGRIGASSRHIWHSAIGRVIIDVSSDDDENEPRGTKKTNNDLFFFFEELQILILPLIFLINNST